MGPASSASARFLNDDCGRCRLRCVARCAKRDARTSKDARGSSLSDATKGLIIDLACTTMYFVAPALFSYLLTMAGIKAGQAVHFRVNGYGDQEFAGKELSAVREHLVLTLLQFNSKHGVR